MPHHTCQREIELEGERESERRINTWIYARLSRYLFVRCGASVCGCMCVGVNVWVFVCVCGCVWKHKLIKASLMRAPPKLILINLITLLA